RALADPRDRRLRGRGRVRARRGDRADRDRATVGDHRDPAARHTDGRAHRGRCRGRWPVELLMRLAIAPSLVLVLVAAGACSPEIAPGAYLCGPERACPEGQACDGPTNICVLTSGAQ